MENKWDFSFLEKGRDRHTMESIYLPHIHAHQLLHWVCSLDWKEIDTLSKSVNYTHLASCPLGAFSNPITKSIVKNKQTSNLRCVCVCNV
jgi:hypothetical protein